MFKDLLTTESAWELLKSSDLPIAVYGTGNGADRVFDEFERLGITPSFVVASDGFVRNRTFRGFQVRAVSQLENEVEDFVVALAFASPLNEVIKTIKALMKKHRVIMPSVPVFDSEIFNKSFLNKHLNEIEEAYISLADEQSKKVFENIIRFQITGNLKYCFDCETSKDEAFEVLNLNEKERFLDLGAYRGDTVREFLKYTKGYEKILAVEPDSRTFKKLQTYCDNIANCVTLNNAVWSENCTVTFDGNKGRGASTKAQGEEKSAISLDYITEKFGQFTYINIDIEGAEAELLKGGSTTLKEKPKLCMAAYHKSQDVFSLVNTIKEINPNYKIFLRHHPHISFWDTNIYCI